MLPPSRPESTRLDETFTLQQNARCTVRPPAPSTTLTLSWRSSQLAPYTTMRVPRSSAL
jgi:hypothetical protein